MTEPRTVSGNFEVHCALTQQRTIKITGVIYSDDTPDDLSKRVDLAQDEIDRQFIRADIQTKEAQVAAQLKHMENLRDSCEALLKKKDAGKLTSQEKLHLQNYEPSIAKTMQEVASIRSAIAEGKRKLGTA